MVQQVDLDVRDVIAILQRQRRLILWTFALLAAGLILFLSLATPVYRATALIQIESVRADLLDADGRGVLQSGILNSLVDSEVEILRSPATGLAVIEAGSLTTDPEFGPQQGLTSRVLGKSGLGAVLDRLGDRIGGQSADANPTDATLRRLQGATDVRRRGLTYLIALSVESTDPEKAARLANLTASVYIDRQIAAKIETTIAARDVLRRQLFVARDDMIAAEAALARYRTAVPARDDFDLAQNLAAARSQHAQILTRVQELDTLANLQIADARIVSDALPPGHPRWPNRLLAVALAGLLAVGLGVGLALLKDHYVGGITSAAQLRNMTGAKAALAIPGQHHGRPEDTPADLVVVDSLSAYAESFRQIRATLDLGLPGGTGGLVILVTSAHPDEGKSTTALALARSYALAGKETLLIDANLRKPALHRLIGIDGNRGLIDHLQGDDALPALPDPVADPMSRLSILPAGPLSADPADQLLGGPAFRALMTDARARHDIVILDSSPFLPVVDARYLAQQADAIVLVVRHAATRQADVRDAARQLTETARAGVPLIAVLNLERHAATRSYGAGLPQAVAGA